MSLSADKQMIIFFFFFNFQQWWWNLAFWTLIFMNQDSQMKIHFEVLWFLTNLDIFFQIFQKNLQNLARFKIFFFLQWSTNYENWCFYWNYFYWMVILKAWIFTDDGIIISQSQYPRFTHELFFPFCR